MNQKIESTTITRASAELQIAVANELNDKDKSLKELLNAAQNNVGSSGTVPTIDKSPSIATSW
jgi:hypothetical protein